MIKNTPALIRGRLAVLALSVLCTFGLHPAVAQTAPATGTVRGVVSNAAASLFLDGAQVALSPGGLVALTERDGRFEFPHVPAGAYTLTVTYAGLKPKTLPGQVAAGATAVHDIGLTAAIYELEKLSLIHI